MLEALSIVTLQKADHARLQEWMIRYDEVGEEEKHKIYKKILRLVTTHAFAEETVLFPSARRLLPHGELLTGEIEAKHQRINELMVELHGLSPGDREFEVRVAALFALLIADLRQEEDQLLSALSGKLTAGQLHALGATWWAVKMAAPTRPHPHVSRRPPGNALAALPLAVADRARDLMEHMRR